MLRISLNRAIIGSCCFAGCRGHTAILLGAISPTTASAEVLIVRKHMATVALPLRGLSADVKVVAASANKTLWHVADKEHQSGFLLRLICSVLSNVLIRWFTHKLATLVAREQKLIDRLNSTSMEELTDVDFLRLADDIQGIVLSTYALVDEAQDMLGPCKSARQSNLEKMRSAADHLDSIAESLRMAADDVCSSLLAELAHQIA